MKRLTIIMQCALLLCACGGGEPETGVTPAPNIFDCVVNIGGDEFKLPMAYADAASMGWVADGELGLDKILAGRHRVYDMYYIEKGDVRCAVDFNNYSDDPQPLADCYISFLTFDNEDGVGFTLPGGLESGKATRKDIIAVYGEPDGGEPGLLYRQEESEFNVVYLIFDSDGLLEGGSIRYGGRGPSQQDD